MKSKNLTRTFTFKIIFSVLLILLVFGVLVGCGKSIVEKEASLDRIANNGMAGGFAQSAPSVAVAEMAVDYDSGWDHDAVEEDYAVGSAVAYKTSMPYPVPPYPDTEPELSYDRKVIKTASLSAEVTDYEAAQIKVMHLAQKYGGFVADSNSYTDHNDKRRGHVYIRVPSIHFDAALIEAGQVGVIKSQSVSGDDVTENYMDMQARLNNSQKEEKRLHEILEKAEDVNDILRVEREISRVRGEIERYQGRLNYLDNHVSLSSINVEMYEPAPVVKSWGIWDAVKDSLNYALATIRFLIRLLGFVLPLAVLGAITTFIILWRIRRKKRRR